MTPNRLNTESSPYLLQHANNPVDWYPWGQEALEKAQREDKLIFLSIGYSACHWCHVMEKETFEDLSIASFLYQHFISIKVDREERPDLDDIYMQAIVTISGSGGWPLNIFLTPNGKPFYGGTYFPPRPRFNLPSFMDVLQNLVNLWENQREKIISTSENLTTHLAQSVMPQEKTAGEVNREILSDAVSVLEAGYDWLNGGWGSAPKFPQPMTIELLVKQAARGDLPALKMANHALNAMSQGGMYDIIGGGFARYSVDASWRTPHFEKMLYDNAQLARVYLFAYLETGNERFRQVSVETLDFLLAEMLDPSGGFYSSIDADSEGVEGNFYIWSIDEILNTIHPSLDADIVITAYGVTNTGNFEGKNILYKKMENEQLANKFNLSQTVIEEKLKRANSQLLSVRNKRIHPQTDTKIITFWNALTLTAFAEAGKYLHNKSYLKTAQNIANFLLSNMYRDEKLNRTWYKGISKFNAYLEDYASLILALLSLYQTDFNPKWYQMALKLANDMIQNFQDPSGGFFDTRNDHEKLLYRPKSLNDNATPSGNAMAASALLQLSLFEGKFEWHDLATRMLQQVNEAMRLYPTSYAQWLSAADFAIGPVAEVVLVGNEASSVNNFALALRRQFQPRLITASASHPPQRNIPWITANRPLINNKTTVYVCQKSTCLNPATTIDGMLSQIEQINKERW